MANPLYNIYKPQNNFNNIVKEARELRKRFTGNPREEVQRLLNSGQMSQEQFNQYAQIAQQVSGMFGDE